MNFFRSVVSGLRTAPYYCAVGTGYLVATAGVFVVIFQVARWLKHGEWPPISMVTALAWMGLDWAAYPGDWIGMHKFLNVVPLSLFLLISGGIIYGTAQAKIDRADEAR